MVAQPVENYASLVRASEDQRGRLRGDRPGSDRWTALAQRFREDPRRSLDDNLSVIASFLEPTDVLLDVGGGAGRYSLPLARLCAEVVNVEPSEGMGQAFDASAREAGIENARWIMDAWPPENEIEGDVSLVANVTYFIEEIVPFIEKLVSASRRRVIIAVSTVPPPNQGADLFRILNSEELAPVPTHRELLGVLWEMDILPDVRVLGAGETPFGTPVFPARADAVEALLQQRQGMSGDVAAARRAIEDHFDDLFTPVAGGFSRLSAKPRLMLITWETSPV